MRILYLFIFLSSVDCSLYAQCNGLDILCDKKYNEVSYLTTHNAYNSVEDGFYLPNQNYNITSQLNAGVRALMIDVYNEHGTNMVYHALSDLGSLSFNQVLFDIKTFLALNPNEIVTIILENYSTANLIENSLEAFNLLPYLYEHQYGNEWPTLQELIDVNTRLVIFSDTDDANPEQAWFHYLWDYAVETHYANTSIQDFSCFFNRGDPNNDLFIFNHFLNHPILGTGVPDEAEIINANPFFINRLIDCMNEVNKFPNFITVDFFDLGECNDVVNQMNTMQNVSVEDRNNFGVHTVLFPNPFKERVVFKSAQTIQMKNIKVFNAWGRDCTNSVLISKTGENMALDLSKLDKGLYVVRLGQKHHALIKE